MPKTVTQMYIHFLRVQSIQGDKKYHGKAETDPQLEFKEQEDQLFLWENWLLTSWRKAT